MYNPKTTREFNFKLVCFASQSRVAEKSKNFRIIREARAVKAFSTIKANGNYPILQIIDIQNELLPQDSLYQQFSVESINKQLQESLSQEELDMQKYDFKKENYQGSQLKLDSFQWDFGFLQQKSGV